MPIRCIDEIADIQTRRGDVVVCMRAQGRSPRFSAWLRSVIAHTASDVRVVVCGSAEFDAGEAGDRELFQTSATGERLFAMIAPADVLLLRSDTVVSAGWLDGLRDAAYSDSRVATASAIASSALPDGWSVDDAVASVRTHSLRLRPKLAAPAGPCTYVRRSALELVGDVSEPELARRCSDAGLSHVLADDVLVGTADSEGYQPGSSPHGDDSSALARSLHRARRALRGMSVVVDARILSQPMTGTQLQILEVIAALARTQSVQLSAIVTDRIDERALRALQSLPEVALVRYADALRTERADVVHRPFQLDNPGDLTFLMALADRLVITHQDLIGYHNPSYFGSHGAWEGYRELTRTALAVADRVVFFSGHARRDALDEELVEADRASVVALGVDHRITRAATQPTGPKGASGLPTEAEVMLCIGNDYRHKNRVFALRMLGELRGRHDWHGRLLLAGPRVENGSSAQEERRILSRLPELAGAVLELGPVSEAEKEWLLGRARLVLYPTLHEGFGLVPFESADHGVPCMWAAGTSLSELLGDDAASIVAWDASASADRALELMRDESERERNVAAIRRAGERLTWDRTAARLLEVYEQTWDAPATAASLLYRGRGVMNGALSEDAARLLGPGGALPSDLERPLLALASHPRIGVPLFGALRLGYRTSHKLRLLARRSGQSRM